MSSGLLSSKLGSDSALRIGQIIFFSNLSILRSFHLAIDSSDATFLFLKQLEQRASRMVSNSISPYLVTKMQSLLIRSGTWNFYASLILISERLDDARLKFSSSVFAVKKQILSFLNGAMIVSKYWVLGNSNASESMNTSFSSNSLAESMHLRASNLTLALIGKVKSRGTGPHALPPPTRPWARLLPFLAAPQPFCGVGFLPEPETSAERLASLQVFLPKHFQQW